MEWADIRRKPFYQTEDQAREAMAEKNAKVRKISESIDKTREINESSFKEMIKRQQAERKALEERLDRTRHARAVKAAAREYLYELPARPEQESEIN